MKNPDRSYFFNCSDIVYTAICSYPVTRKYVIFSKHSKTDAPEYLKKSEEMFPGYYTKKYLTGSDLQLHIIVLLVVRM